MVKSLAQNISIIPEEQEFEMQRSHPRPIKTNQWNSQSWSV